MILELKINYTKIVTNRCYTVTQCALHAGVLLWNSLSDELTDASTYLFSKIITDDIFLTICDSQICMT